MRVNSSLALLITTLLSVTSSPLAMSAQKSHPTEADPTQNDPPLNLKPPASAEEIKISSPRGPLNGLLYLPAGPGTHPIVLFLHGYPGNERNLDWAQAVRRAGYAVAFFDYRGIFGTPGTFSWANGREDVAAALAWLRSPEIARQYRLDTARIAIVGHSFGGWLALMSVEHEAPDVCVAALAAWNAGWAKGRYASHPDEMAEDLSYYRVTTDGTGGPVHADPEALVREGNDDPEQWNYLSQVGTLKKRALWLVAASRDSADENIERHQELASAIRAQGGTLVQLLTLEDDHVFSSHRIALAQTLIHWLRTDCAKTQP